MSSYALSYVPKKLCVFRFAFLLYFEIIDGGALPSVACLCLSRLGRQDDLQATKTSSQPGQLAGSTQQEIADNIHSSMKTAGIDSKECGEYSVAELNDIVRALFKHGMSNDLEQVYRHNTDGRSRRFSARSECERVGGGDAL